MSRAARLLAPWVGVAACILMAACSSDKAQAHPVDAGQRQDAGQVWSAKLESIQYPLAIPGTGWHRAGWRAPMDRSCHWSPPTGREQRAQGTALGGVGFDGRFAAVVTAGNELR